MNRKAYTLVEMLVVVGIIVSLAGILVAFGPRIRLAVIGDSAPSMIQQALLIAKQRALRDGVPSGVRLLVDPATGFVTTLRYVQQPDPISFSGTVSATQFSAAAVPQYYDYVDLSAGSAPDFIGDMAAFPYLWNVQPGDYIQLPDGPVQGTMHLIGGKDSAGNPITSPVLTAHRLQINWGGAPQAQVSSFGNFKITRSPRPLQGENSDIKLPQGTYIDTNAMIANGYPLPADPVTGNVDIMFRPDGMMQVYSALGKVILWVRGPDVQQELVVGYVRTGRVAVYAVGSTADPFQFVRDGS